MTVAKVKEKLVEGNDNMIGRFTNCGADGNSITERVNEYDSLLALLEEWAEIE